MSFRHSHGALTLAEYRALEAAGAIQRPLTDAPIGGSTATKRAADDAASRAWDEPDRPSLGRRRAVGPRGHLDGHGNLIPGRTTKEATT